MFARNFRVGTTVALLAACAHAQSIWIVDAANGPQAHFTDLPPAVAAATDGDVLLVRPGQYSPLALSGKALTVLGESKTSVFVGWQSSTTSTISDVSGASPIALSGITVRKLLLSNCTAPIFVESAVIDASMTVSGCSDLRGRYVVVGGQWSTTAETTLSNSRYEGVGCVHFGRRPQTVGSGAAPDGFAGLKAGGSSVHLASSRCRGGTGGSTSFFPSNCFEAPGDGGPGLHLHTGSTALAAWGSPTLFRGGDAGVEPSTWYGGRGGHAVVGETGSVLTLSGPVSLSPGEFDRWAFCAGPGQPFTGGGTLQSSAPRQPVLETREQAPDPLGFVGLRLTASAGSQVNLLIGNDLSITPTGGVLVPQLTTPQQVVPIGTMPVGDRLLFQANVGPQPTGALVVLQVEIVLPNGAVARSNSAPILFR
jgi:hypothetical protein